MMQEQRRLYCTALALVLMTTASAVERWVAPSGNDGSTGSATAPLRTIARGVALAQAGDTVVVRAGTYRESLSFTISGRADAPITISAAPGERPVVKGSRVVVGWVQHAGEVWKKTGWSANTQQVFVDDSVLQQIGYPSPYYTGVAGDGSIMIEPVGSGLADLARGRFWWDAAGSTLYVQLPDGGDPNAHLVEAGTAHRIVSVESSAAWITFRGLAFRHSATAGYQYGGAAIELGDHNVMEDCDIQWCDFGGVAPGWRRTGTRIERCTIANNGNVGINGSGHSDFTVRDCILSGNNYRRFNTEWQAGGAKFTAQSWGLIERCTVRDNIGMGIWFDYCDSGQPIICRDNLVTGCTLKGEGLIAEASKNILFANNLVTANERRGIYISASEDVRVHHNTVIGNRGWCAIDLGSGMPRPGKALRNVSVRNNLIAGNSGQFDARVFVENGGDITGLAWDGNLVWRGGAPLALWYGQDARAGWAGTAWQSIESWRSASPHGDHDRSADPRLDSFGLPAIGSPAVDAGEAVTGVPVDRIGTPRPQGPAVDLGAWERLAPANTPPRIDASSAGSGTITGTTTALTVSASDDGDPAALTYRWTSSGPSEVLFSANGSNAARAAVATFRAAGAYTLGVTVRDAGGLAVSANLPVVVQAVAASVVVTPATALVRTGATLAFAATVRDQFAAALSAQPTPVWSSSGGGSIGADGVLRAGTTVGGPHTITASAAGVAGTAQLSVVEGVAARISFQPAQAPTWQDWLVDAGEPFADRGNGLSYGWNGRNDATRDRNDPTSPDQRYDTLVMTQKAPNKDAAWELAVPAGSYRVRLVAGDPLYAPGRYRFAVEGQVVLDARPTATSRWAESTTVVSVGDGRLTVRNAAGASGNRLCFIEITAVPAGNG